MTKTYLNRKCQVRSANRNTTLYFSEYYIISETNWLLGLPVLNEIYFNTLVSLHKVKKTVLYKLYL